MASLQQRKERVAMLSVASNSILVGFKVIVGMLIGFVSSFSSAIHWGDGFTGGGHRTEVCTAGCLLSPARRLQILGAVKG